MIFSFARLRTVSAGLFLFISDLLPVHPQARLPLEQNILIADRGNNRIIEGTPDRRIVWEFQFENLRPGTVP